MVGMCIAVFVLLLGFVYQQEVGNPSGLLSRRHRSRWLFLGCSPSGIRGSTWDCLVVDVRTNDVRRAEARLGRGELLMTLGLVLSVWVPVLSLFALGPNLLGIYGVVLVVACLIFLLHDRRVSRQGRF